MKNVLLFSLLLTALGSCKKEEVLEAQTSSYPQTWQLVQLTGQIPPYVRTGATLTWQETYVFQADSTFTKTRQQGGQTSQAQGTFSVRSAAGGPYTILTYNATNNLINSCTPSNLKEHLTFTAQGMLSSSSQACDGPLLEYQKL